MKAVEGNLGSAHIDQAEADRVRDLLHKLVGMFGDDRLGELASHLNMHGLLNQRGAGIFRKNAFRASEKRAEP